MHRVLKAEGHFSVSDIVLARPLPAGIQEAAEMYAGCVSGAILKDEYLKIIDEAGFRNVDIRIEKPIHLPDEVLSRYMTPEDATNFKKQGAAILSITVFGER